MNAHDDSATDYQSYMLRMWRKRDGAGHLMWCASLEEPGSHETISFGDVRTMCAFVQSRLGLVPPGAPAQEEQPAQEEDQK
jgi:hypothetical protein